MSNGYYGDFDSFADEQRAYAEHEAQLAEQEAAEAQCEAEAQAQMEAEANAAEAEQGDDIPF